MRFIEIERSRHGGNWVRQLRTAVGHEGLVAAAVIGDQGGPHSVRWLRVADGAEVLRRDLPIAGGEPDPVLLADLSVLAFVRRDQDSDLILLEKPTAPPPNQCILESGGRYNSLAVSPDGQIVMACTDDGIAGWKMGSAFENSASVDPHTASIPLAMYMSEGGARGRLVIGPTGLSVMDNGDGVCSVLLPGCVDWAGVLDLPDGGCCRALLFDPTGGFLCTATGKAALLWHNTADQEEADELAAVAIVLRLEHDSPVTAAGFSPDGSVLATGAEDGVVRLWDLATGNLRSALDCQVGAIGAVVFSPDGFICLAGGGWQGRRLGPRWREAGERVRTGQNLCSRRAPPVQLAHRGRHHPGAAPGSGSGGTGGGWGGPLRGAGSLPGGRPARQSAPGLWRRQRRARWAGGDR